MKFPLEKSESSDTGTYRKAALAALAALLCIPCYQRSSPSPSALHHRNTQELTSSNYCLKSRTKLLIYRVAERTSK